jgi:hypothetical protein
MALAQCRMMVSHVDDAELLYRAVRANSDEYRTEGGALRITVTAFNDREYKPSVDRSAICSNAEAARRSSTDGVTSLVTQEVRAISTVAVDAPTGRIDYKVDVMHRPVVKSESEPRDNPAHCQVECAPDITRTHYRRLKEALAILATRRGWTISP